MSAMRDEAAIRPHQVKVRFLHFATSAKNIKGGKRTFAASAKRSFARHLADTRTRKGQGRVSILDEVSINVLGSCEMERIEPPYISQCGVELWYNFRSTPLLVTLSIAAPR